MPEVRTCRKCNESKAIDLFATYRSKSGELRRRGCCRECRESYARENESKLREYRKQYNETNGEVRRERGRRRRKELQGIVDKYKSEPCVDCGRTFDPVCMDFDHVRGVKVKPISTMVSQAYKIESIIEEIKKCDLVCACCHRIRTKNRNQNLAVKTAVKRTARSHFSATDPICDIELQKGLFDGT